MDDDTLSQSMYKENSPLPRKTSYFNRNESLTSEIQGESFAREEDLASLKRGKSASQENSPLSRKSSYFDCNESFTREEYLLSLKREKSVGFKEVLVSSPVVYNKRSSSEVVLSCLKENTLPRGNVAIVPKKTVASSVLEVYARNRLHVLYFHNSVRLWANAVCFEELLPNYYNGLYDVKKSFKFGGIPALIKESDEQKQSPKFYAMQFKMIYDFLQDLLIVVQNKKEEAMKFARTKDKKIITIRFYNIIEELSSEIMHIQGYYIKYFRSLEYK